MKHLLTEDFSCRECGEKDFIKVYTFSIRFREVDFSEEPIYEKIEEERYRCVSCKATYSPQEVKDALRMTKRKIKMKA